MSHSKQAAGHRRQHHRMHCSSCSNVLTYGNTRKHGAMHRHHKPPWVMHQAARLHQAKQQEASEAHLAFQLLTDGPSSPADPQSSLSHGIQQRLPAEYPLGQLLHPSWQWLLRCALRPLTRCRRHQSPAATSADPSDLGRGQYQIWNARDSRISPKDSRQRAQPMIRQEARHLWWKSSEHAVG